MGWFSKKEDSKRIKAPELPKLPKLPELPKLDEEEEMPKLPSLPASSLGEKFSQDAIKDAVSHGSEKEKEIPELELPKTKVKVPEEFKEAVKKVKKKEPVFIRIDKFEESLDNFEKAKEKIHEIEKLLQNIKEIREEEEEELKNWSEELEIIKSEFENIDNDLFSSLE
jgi:predicted ribosome quality control (RQC) complex YloA/Tae2 family protein